MLDILVQAAPGAGAKVGSARAARRRTPPRLRRGRRRSTESRLRPHHQTTDDDRFFLAPPRSYIIAGERHAGPASAGLRPAGALACSTSSGRVDLWVGVEGENAERGAMARHGLMRAVAGNYGGEQIHDHGGMARARASARARIGTPGRVFQEIVACHRPAGRGREEPVLRGRGAMRMRGLLKAFPDARFIHLIRHPYPAGQSR